MKVEGMSGVVARWLGCGLLLGAITQTAAAQPVVMSVIDPDGELLPVQLAVNDGGGYVFSTLTDDDADGIVETVLPPGSSWAIQIDEPIPVEPGCDIWQIMGSEVSGDDVPFEIPVFRNAAGGSLGVDLGAIVLPPPMDFLPGEIYGVLDGVLASWPTLRFIDTAAVPGLPEFVAGIDALPNYDGDVEVSDFLIRFEFIPAPPSVALLVLGMLGRPRRRR